MSSKNKRLISVICLLSAVLLCILGCNAMPTIKVALTPDPNRFPVKSWNITMDLTQREEFFTQLQNFADKHSLELRSTFYDADKKSFLTVLAGDGFHISTLSMLSPRDIRINFYNEASPPTSQETLNELSVDLKSHLKDIPSMVIKEKLQRMRVTMVESWTPRVFTELYAQLQKFADRHSFEFTTISYNLELETFLVELSGDGFQTTIEVVRSIPGEINVDIYVHYADNGEPTSTSQEIVANLFDDLKSFFGEIPNVMIEEVK